MFVAGGCREATDRPPPQKNKTNRPSPWPTKNLFGTTLSEHGPEIKPIFMMRLRGTESAIRALSEGRGYVKTPKSKSKIWFQKKAFWPFRGIWSTNSVSLLANKELYAKFICKFGHPLGKRRPLELETFYFVKSLILALLLCNFCYHNTILRPQMWLEIFDFGP